MKKALFTVALVAVMALGMFVTSSAPASAQYRHHRGVYVGSWHYRSAPYGYPHRNAWYTSGVGYCYGPSPYVYRGDQVYYNTWSPRYGGYVRYRFYWDPYRRGYYYHHPYYYYGGGYYGRRYYGPGYYHYNSHRYYGRRYRRW